MNAAAIHSREQALAGALAFAMHVLLLVFLVFGVSWQHQQIDTAAVVDLWRDLPPLTPPKAEVPPPPAVKPVPPPPVPKVEVKPPPKPEPAPAPKPDIALKEKLEKERKLREQKAAEAKKIAAEKVREAELEKKKRAEAEALKQRQAAEAEAKRVAAEQQKARDALAAQQAAAQAKVVDEYKRRIVEKVRRFIVLPPNVSDNARVEFEVVMLPGGEVLGAKLKGSANSIPAYDAAVERAILKAQPLPLPPDPALMRQFRELNLVFRPKE
ncbi:MAG: TonB C-terminal domain-containing protein [Burkholderiales bacterium]